MRSCFQIINQVLEDTYGRDNQDLSGEALDRWDESVRGNGVLMECIAAFKNRYEPVVDKTGLEVNEICRTRKFLKGSGLLQR